MTEKLFLGGIFTDECQSPSMIKITMPFSQTKFSVNLVGLMTSDFSFSAQNKWGPVINDLSNLQDLASLLGQSSMPTWIAASTMCWKGTAPLSLGVEFYLINYKKGLNIEENLKSLIKLASLEENKGSMTSGFTAIVHGGFTPDIFKNNENYFTRGKIGSVKDIEKHVKVHQEQGGDYSGTLQIEIGKKAILRNLLLSKIDVSESLVEVSDSNGNNRKPLYYRVNAQFTGARPFLTVDVDNMFSVQGR